MENQILKANRIILGSFLLPRVLQGMLYFCGSTCVILKKKGRKFMLVTLVYLSQVSQIYLTSY